MRADFPGGTGTDLTNCPKRTILHRQLAAVLSVPKYGLHRCEQDGSLRHGQRAAGSAARQKSCG
jgi:hypothetical protein